MEKREIERNPEIPDLNNDLLKLLTELCFRKDDELEPVDLLFIFGTSGSLKELGELVRSLLDKNISKKVFISGGGPLYLDVAKNPDASESHLILKEIEPQKYPNVEFLFEEKSKNTLENVTEALNVLDFSSYRKILFVAKSHASKRCYLTLKRFLPSTKILQKAYNRLYNDTQNQLGRDTWQTFEFGKGRVLGEFLRIKKYGERGDIFYDTETGSLVEQIDKELEKLPHSKVVYKK